MSVANNKKWNLRDLYPTPEFPEDMRKVTDYDEPANHSRALIAAIVLLAVMFVSLCALIVSGAIQLPVSPAALQKGLYPPAGMPLVSEIMTGNNNAFPAENGKYYDWIEIYNPTKTEINLSGFGLSDNPDKPGKFIFPAYSLAGGKYAVVFATGKKSSRNDIEASFKLNSSGTLLFTDAQGNRIQQIDYLYVPQGKSFATDMSDFSKWSLTDKFTPGYPNTNEGYDAFRAAYPSTVQSSD